ncbi:MAG: hypothetical protein J0H86_14365 [Xanthomonadaceae bacterium]|nr:hypothetical protein [Xanthomonadaceae bacterium]
MPFLAAALLLLAPAAYAGAIRLIERNGDQLTARDVVELRIPRDGVVVYVSDSIFAARFEP